MEASKAKGARALAYRKGKWKSRDEPMPSAWFDATVIGLFFVLGILYLL